MDFRLKKGISGLVACTAVDYPTLYDISRSHGLECACLVVEVFIINLLDTVNLPGKKAENPPMEEWQISETAQLIYEECPGLKITELFEFVRMIKKGRYGEFYGSIDSIKIMSNFQEFLRERASAIMASIRKREAEIQKRRIDLSFKMPEERDEWLATMTAEEKIELRVCPKCNSSLIDGKCISCENRKK